MHTLPGPQHQAKFVIPLVSASAGTCLSLPIVRYPHPTFHLHGVLQTPLPLQLSWSLPVLPAGHSLPDTQVQTSEIKQVFIRYLLSSRVSSLDSSPLNNFATATTLQSSPRGP